VTKRTQLTKSLFQTGLACSKRLWWEVHEPESPELVPDAQTVSSPSATVRMSSSR
jgi:hypothetical protein